MHFIVNQVVQLNHIHNADKDVVFERFAGFPVIQRDFRTFGKSGRLQFAADLFVRRRLEDRSRIPLFQFQPGPTQLGFQQLPQIHTRRNAQRIETDVQRRTVGHIRHLLHRQNARYDAFVSVATGHLVAFPQFAFDGHQHLHHFVDAGTQFVAVIFTQTLNINDDSLRTVRHPQRGIPLLLRFLAENRAHQF